MISNIRRSTKTVLKQSSVHYPVCVCVCVSEAAVGELFVTQCCRVFGRGLDGIREALPRATIRGLGLLQGRTGPNSQPELCWSRRNESPKPIWVRCTWTGKICTSAIESFGLLSSCAFGPAGLQDIVSCQFF